MEKQIIFSWTPKPPTYSVAKNVQIKPTGGS
jgi:hypothetical protein